MGARDAALRGATRPPCAAFTRPRGEINVLAFKWIFVKSESLKVGQIIFISETTPQSDSGNQKHHLCINRLCFQDTYIPHVCWCWVDGWGRMQIFNVVTELDWMFYGLSLSWQRATACKSNWKEGNEGAGTPLYQALGCKNRIWHCITQWAEFIWGAKICTISDENIQYS